MYKRLSKILFILLMSSLGACSLVDPTASKHGLNNSPDSVKISSIKFSVRHLTASEAWVYFPDDIVDITSFRNIDSVRFGANMRSQNYPERCIVELYDFTNDRPVYNSTVDASVRYYFKYVESLDIYPVFPKGEVLMGIRMRSSKEGNHVEIAYDSEILIFSH